MCVVGPSFDGYVALDGTSFASPAVAGSAALCATTAGSGLQGRALGAKLLDLVRAYHQRNPRDGFVGDPRGKPIPGRYYGYLLNQSML